MRWKEGFMWEGPSLGVRAYFLAGWLQTPQQPLASLHRIPSSTEGLIGSFSGSFQLGCFDILESAAGTEHFLGGILRRP